MKLHSWNVSCSEARNIQQELRPQLSFTLLQTDFRYVAGADVALDAVANRVLATVVVLDVLTGCICDEASVICPVEFPYVPGLLSFREAPAVLAAWSKLKTAPEVLLVDGQGWAHPRRFGLACHLGLWLKTPTVGCAKSRLIGQYEEPGPKRGNWAALYDGNEVIGAVLRTRDRVRPIFVSQGDQLPLASCIQLTLQWARGYRLPEPTRQAHLRVTARRKAMTKHCIQEQI
jgi:deoxyribonuclease V